MGFVVATRPESYLKLIQGYSCRAFAGIESTLLEKFFKLHFQYSIFLLFYNRRIGDLRLQGGETIRRVKKGAANKAKVADFRFFWYD